MLLVPDPEPLAWCETPKGLTATDTVDVLNDRIGVLSAQIHMLEAELVSTVAEFDTAGGRQGGGLRSMGHWLSIRSKFTVSDSQRIARVAQRIDQTYTFWNGPTCLGSTLRRTQPGGRAPDLMHLPGLDHSPTAPDEITPDTPESGTRGEHLTRYALDVHLSDLLTAG